MDEAAYRAARGAAVPSPCVFAKAILAGAAGCQAAVRHALAERESIGCTSPAGHADCATLTALLRERAAFVLRLRTDAPLPHVAAMKLQCGGLAGLATGVGMPPTDVRVLAAQALARNGSPAGLPWADIVAAVAQWQGRRRYRGGEA